jgi:glutamine synthetase
MSSNLARLKKAVDTAEELHGDSRTQAEAYRDQVFVALNELRENVDVLETLVDADYWPLPTYSELLYMV